MAKFSELQRRGSYLKVCLVLSSFFQTLFCLLGEIESKFTAMVCEPCLAQMIINH